MAEVMRKPKALSADIKSSPVPDDVFDRRSEAGSERTSTASGSSEDLREEEEPPPLNALSEFPALRILEPARKKLVTIDTQRIIWCLDECIRQHKIITSLMLVVLRDESKLEELKPSLGVDLYKALLRFRKLYEELERAYTASDLNLPVIEGKICESCKDLLRLFQTNQTAVNTCISFIPDNIAIPGGRKFHQPKRLIEGLTDLRKQMFERLLTTPIECKERTRYLKKVAENQDSNNVTTEKLEKQLADAIKNKEDEVAKKNEQIRKLKNDLHQIEEFSTENLKNTKRESERQKASDQRTSDSKLQKLNHDYDLANSVYDKMLQEHREAERKLRTRKYKIETEVENWITKYDQEMTEKQDEYEEIDAVYTEEKKQLSELEEKFAVLNEEYEKIMEERRIAREKREVEDKDYNMKKEAATTIQAYFRAYKVRKMLKDKPSKSTSSKRKKR